MWLPLKLHQYYDADPESLNSNSNNNIIVLSESGGKRAYQSSEAYALLEQLFAPRINYILLVLNVRCSATQLNQCMHCARCTEATQDYNTLLNTLVQIALPFHELWDSCHNPTLFVNRETVYVSRLVASVLPCGHNNNNNDREQSPH